MCLYIGTHVWMWGACGDRKKTSDLLELLIMNHSVWVLGTERWSSAGTINHRAISRVLLIHIFTTASRTLGTVLRGSREEGSSQLTAHLRSKMFYLFPCSGVKCEVQVLYQVEDCRVLLLPEIFHLSGKTSSLKTQTVLLTFAFILYGSKLCLSIHIGFMSLFPKMV